MQSPSDFAARYIELVTHSLLTCEDCPLLCNDLKGGLARCDHSHDFCTVSKSVYDKCHEYIGGAFIGVVFRIPEAVRRQLLALWNGTPRLHITESIPAGCELRPSLPFGMSNDGRVLYFAESVIDGCPQDDLGPIQDAIATLLAIQTVMSDPLWPGQYEEQIVRERLAAWRFRFYDPSPS